MDDLTTRQRIRVEAVDAAIRAVSMPELKIDDGMTHCDLIKIAREFEDYIRVEIPTPPAAARRAERQTCAETCWLRPLKRGPVENALGGCDRDSQALKCASRYEKGYDRGASQIAADSAAVCG